MKDHWFETLLQDWVDQDSPICYGILMPGDDFPGGTPVIKVKDYFSGKVNEQLLTHTTPTIDEQYSRSRLQAGDILLSIRGSTGVVAVVPPSLEGANITQDTARLRIRHDHCSEYLVQVLQSKSVQHQIRLNTIGQAVKGINLAEVRRLIIPTPAEPERRAIAALLVTWDCAIEQVTRLFETKQRLKLGLMQQLLDVNSCRTRSKLTSVHLGEIFSERVETSRHDLPLLSITADRGVVPRGEVEKRDTSSADKTLYKRIVPGDIGYNTMRMWQGVSALSTLEGIVSPAYTICIPKDGIIGSFAKHLFKYPPVVHQFWRYSQGLVDDTLNLKFHHFAEVVVSIPDVDEQRRSALILDTADRELILLTQQLQALQRQKQALLQKLLTGEVSVKVGEA